MGATLGWLRSPRALPLVALHVVIVAADIYLALPGKLSNFVSTPGPAWLERFGYWQTVVFDAFCIGQVAWAGVWLGLASRWLLLRGGLVVVAVVAVTLPLVQYEMRIAHLWAIIMAVFALLSAAGAWLCRASLLWRVERVFDAATHFTSTLENETRIAGAAPSNAPREATAGSARQYTLRTAFALFCLAAVAIRLLLPQFRAATGYEQGFLAGPARLASYSAIPLVGLLGAWFAFGGARLWERLAAWLVGTFAVALMVYSAHASTPHSLDVYSGIHNGWPQLRWYFVLPLAISTGLLSLFGAARFAGWRLANQR